MSQPTATVTTTTTTPPQPISLQSQPHHSTIDIRTTTSATWAPAIAALGAQGITATVGTATAPADLRAYLASAYAPAAIAADLADAAKTTFIATTATTATDPSPDDDDDDDAAAAAATQQLLGFVVLRRGSSAAEPCLAHLPPAAPIELQRVYVAHAAQGTGVGGALVRAAEAAARREGRECVWLGVWEGNGAAQRAYARWGYERWGERDFLVGGAPQRNWVLVKKLEV